MMSRSAAISGLTWAIASRRARKACKMPVLERVQLRRTAENPSRAKPTHRIRKHSVANSAEFKKTPRRDRDRQGEARESALEEAV